MKYRLNTFLCYPSHDSIFARRIYERFSAYAWIRPWLEFGKDWKKTIESAIQGADVVVILISKKSISQKAYSEGIFERTIELIKENRKKALYVVPLRLDECTPPQILQHLEWRDYFGKNAQEELINSLSKFTGGPAIYATENQPILSTPSEFPVPNSSDSYENLDWLKYISIPSTSNILYSFLIGKYHITNEQYLKFLRAEDYADDFYWTDFPKYDENGDYIGSWGNAGLLWLKEKLKQYPSLLERRMDWTWRESSFGRGADYNYRQPLHYAQTTWFEANAYCKWFSRHWQELPGSRNLSSLIDTDSSFSVRLPLEKEFHVAVKYDDLSRIEIDPTLRLGAKRHPGLALDISTQDMLANLYGESLPDYLKYSDGFLYIDEYTRELARVSYYGSLRPDEEWNSYGFRMVFTESR